MFDEKRQKKSWYLENTNTSIDRKEEFGLLPLIPGITPTKWRSAHWLCFIEIALAWEKLSRLYPECSLQIALNRDFVALKTRIKYRVALKW